MSAINLGTGGMQSMPIVLYSIILKHNTFPELIALASSSTHLRKTTISKAYQIMPEPIKKFIEDIIAGLDGGKYPDQIDRLTDIQVALQIPLNESSNLSILKSHFLNSKAQIINILETIEEGDLEALLTIDLPEFFEDTITLARSSVRSFDFLNRAIEQGLVREVLKIYM